MVLEGAHRDDSDTDDDDDDDGTIPKTVGARDAREHHQIVTLRRRQQDSVDWKFSISAMSLPPTTQ